MKEYNLIPFHEIEPEARKIAVEWVNNYEGGIDIRQKHKLASDIMNYAASRMKKKDVEIEKLRSLLLKANESIRNLEFLVKDITKGKGEFPF